MKPPAPGASNRSRYVNWVCLEGEISAITGGKIAFPSVPLTLMSTAMYVGRRGTYTLYTGMTQGQSNAQGVCLSKGDGVKHIALRQRSY